MAPARLDRNANNYVLSPEGQRLLMLRREGPGRDAEPFARMILVPYWFDEPKSKVPVP